MKRTKRLGLMLAAAMFFATGVVLAQTPVEEPAPVQWLKYVALAINSVLVPMAVDWLRTVWSKLPSFVHTFVPLVAGSVITMAVSYLSQLLGYPVDLSLLEQFLTGGFVGLGASMGYKTARAK